MDAETTEPSPTEAPIWFHVSTRLWRPGEQIPAGHFGDMLRQTGGAADQKFTMWWELVFETYRHAFGIQPSRLHCVFVTETLGVALAFRDRFRGGTARIYRVSALHPDTPTFRGDFEVFGQIQSALDELPERARRYWTETERITPEVLVGGPVVVVEEVTPVPAG